MHSHLPTRLELCAAITPVAFMDFSTPSFTQARTAAPTPHTSPSNSIHALPDHPSTHPFLQAFIPNPSAFIKPLSPATSMETLGFLQFHMGDFATSSATPYSYTAPPINMAIHKTELPGFPIVAGRIKDTPSRQVAFCKRRTGLFKKAHELSVLCDAEIAILIFSPSGKLSEFASSSMGRIIKRYQSFQPRMPSNNPILEDVEIWKNKAILLNNRLKCLQDFQRCVIERKNMSLSINEVQTIESMIENTLDKIRKRKEEILFKENHMLKEKIIKIMEMKECVPHYSSGWKKSSYHQDNVSTKLQLGLDI